MLLSKVLLTCFKKCSLLRLHEAGRLRAEKAQWQPFPQTL